jgi:IMP dehydrogenase
MMVLSNLLGALKTSMGTLGAKNLKEMQQVEVVIAPLLADRGESLSKGPAFRYG